MALAALLTLTSLALAQPARQPARNTNPSLLNVNPFFNRAVGGISIDADGLLENASVDALGELRRLRANALAPIPKELDQTVGIRKVSLRRLQAAIQECRAKNQELPDTMKYLAGLQRISYVLVYPEEKDIVLVGPAEGWRVDAKGNVVGSRTGRPVMQLDDLAVALRSAVAQHLPTITCSIDPTAAGLTRVRDHVAKLHTIGTPSVTAAGIAQALGKQEISFTGVPADSHFARVLLGADYRMKRLAMNFEPAPIEGLPSFLHMMKAEGRGMSNLLPRWWLAPNYQPLLRDPEGLAWQLRGASVRAVAEEDLLAAGGDRQPTGKASTVARQWAENMTKKYDELAVAEPVFGQLQNCMDLAIVGALIVHEDLASKSGCDLRVLLGPSELPSLPLGTPRQVASQASLLKKNGNWVISVSGGVKIDVRIIVEKPEKTTRLKPVRDEAKLGEHKDWWWN
jgi:hypothetical protein